MGLRHREPQLVCGDGHVPVAAMGIAGYLLLAGLGFARQRFATFLAASPASSSPFGSP